MAPKMWRFILFCKCVAQIYCLSCITSRFRSANFPPSWIFLACWSIGIQWCSKWLFEIQMHKFGLPRNFAFQLHYLYKIICASLILFSWKSHFSRSISKTPTFEAETMREEISRTRNLIMETAERNAYTQIVRDKFSVYFSFFSRNDVLRTQI